MQKNSVHSKFEALGCSIGISNFKELEAKSSGLLREA